MGISTHVRRLNPKAALVTGEAAFLRDPFASSPNAHYVCPWCLDYVYLDERVRLLIQERVHFPVRIPKRLGAIKERAEIQRATRHLPEVVYLLHEDCWFRARFAPYVKFRFEGEERTWPT